MTTVQIVLPDGLAQDAQAAGLLTPERMEKILREQLRLRAGEALQATWQRLPAEELTSEIEQEIVDGVRAVRKEQRVQSSTSAGPHWSMTASLTPAFCATAH